MPKTEIFKELAALGLTGPFSRHQSASASLLIFKKELM